MNQVYKQLAELFNQVPFLFQKIEKKLQWRLRGKFKNSLNCYNPGCMQDSRNFWFYGTPG